MDFGARLRCKPRAPRPRRNSVRNSRRKACRGDGAGLHDGRRRDWRRHSWPEGFGEILGAALKFRAAGQLREQFFQRAAVVRGDQFVRLAVQQAVCLCR